MGCHLCFEAWFGPWIAAAAGAPAPCHAMRFVLASARSEVPVRWRDPSCPFCSSTRARTGPAGNPTVAAELRSWLAGLRPPGLEATAVDDAGSGAAGTTTESTGRAARAPTPELEGAAGAGGPTPAAASEHGVAEERVATSAGMRCAPGGPFGVPVPYGVGLVAADELRHETYGSAAQRAAYQQRNNQQQQQEGKGAVQGTREAAPGTEGRGVVGEAAACSHGAQVAQTGGRQGAGDGRSSQGGAAQAAAAAPAAAPAGPGGGVVVAAAAGGDILPIAMEVRLAGCCISFRHHMLLLIMY